MATFIIPSPRLSLALARRALARTSRMRLRVPKLGRSLAELPFLDRASRHSADDDPAEICGALYD